MANNSDKPKKKKPSGRPFAKGTSGNPGGRPKTPFEVLEAARERSVRAVERLAELMEHDEPYAVTAANALLDRGWGKPNQPMTLDLQNATDAELLKKLDEAKKLLTDEAKSK